MEIPRVYIEACPFIDMAKFKADKDLTEKRKGDVWFCQQLLKAARNGEVKVFTSTISIAECTTVAQGENVPSHDIQRFYDSLLLSGKSGVILVEASPTICERARGLRWTSDTNLSGADAIHVASAIHLKCSEILTQDGKIKKNSAKILQLGISVLSPSESQVLPAKYRQLSLEGT